MSVLRCLRLAAVLSMSCLQMAHADGGGRGGGEGVGGFRPFVPSPPPSFIAPQLAPSAPAAPFPPPQTPRLMSDTPEFCAELLSDIAHRRQLSPVLPPNVEVLAAEGERLCEMGHYRPGITRLRMALLILRHTR